MKRIGSLYSQARVRFRERLLPLLGSMHECFEKDLKKQLKKESIDLCVWKDLEAEEKAHVTAYYQNNIFPVLTPLSVDSGHPFPFLSNLSISLGVLLKHTDREEELFARVKIPSHFPRWIRVDNKKDAKGARFISIVDVMIQHLDGLFYGMEIVDVMPFRVTRNTNVERDEEDTDDLMELIAEEIKERRFGEVVRLEHERKPSHKILEFLQEELRLDEDQIYEVNGLLEYIPLKPIVELSRADLKYEPWIPVPPFALIDPDRDIFQAIKQGDILVHHPYESFTASVERFLRSAVNDSKVIAIKMTLYRVGADSPLVSLLCRAAELGKSVVCLVELKARFDEEKNILVAQKLEDSGVHVVYGVVGLKTHCKLALVVRQEGEEARSYCHIGTGNYHSVTARLYTDLGLFTCKKEISDDVVNLFHYLTGRSAKKDYKKLMVAPVTMKDQFLKKIVREITNAKKGLPARIIAKVNSLDERDITHALYEASQAGVQVDLIVRGFCCLRPGVKGLSDNIRVFSVIGRFLEHSRIFYFQNGEKDLTKGEFFMGSADWMHRNLLTRVEAIAPIEEPAHRERVWEILSVMLEDHRQGWEMDSSGRYTRRKVKNQKKDIGTHAYFMQKARNRGL